MNIAFLIVTWLLRRHHLLHSGSSPSYRGRGRSRSRSRTPPRRRWVRITDVGSVMRVVVAVGVAGERGCGRWKGLCPVKGGLLSKAVNVFCSLANCWLKRSVVFDDSVWGKVSSFRFHFHFISLLEWFACHHPSEFLQRFKNSGKILVIFQPGNFWKKHFFSLLV